MFAGHIGAGLALGSKQRKINVGVFVTLAFLLDIVLWILVLTGVESATIPSDYVATHQLQFVFPYSHGLLASVIWAIAMGVIALVVCSAHSVSKLHTAMIIAAAVFSHWVLDFIVHQPELPVAGAYVAGLGLWNNMPVALTVEAVITVLGLWWFLRGSALSRRRKVVIAVVTLFMLAFTVTGLTVAPPPPSVTLVAISSLATLIIICAILTWAGHSKS